MITIDYKSCTICQQEKGVAEFYSNVKRSCCKSCLKEKNANYYKANSERLKKRQIQWQKENFEASRSTNLRWRKDNPDKIRKRHNKWSKNNPEKVRANGEKYRKTLKGQNAFNKASRKRRALKNNSLHHEHDFSFESVLEKMRQRLTTCLGIPFDLDHILPISQGGPHHHGNLQVIPATLNRAKFNSLDFVHPVIIHWSSLPHNLINWKNSQLKDTHKNKKIK